MATHLCLRNADQRKVVQSLQIAHENAHDNKSLLLWLIKSGIVGIFEDQWVAKSSRKLPIAQAHD